MAIGRFTIFAALAVLASLVAVLYPHESFSTVSGALVAFSASSTLLFFSFGIIAAIIGFDRGPRRHLEQAQPTSFRELGDPFTH